MSDRIAIKNQDLVARLCDYLENRQIQSDFPLCLALTAKIKKISTQDPLELVSHADRAIYNCATHLLNREGGIRRVIKEQFLELIDSSGKFGRLDVPQQAFGKAKLLQFFGALGDIGEEPVLPKGIHQMLQEQDPINCEQKVGDTHRLICIPKKMNYTLFNLKNLEGLLQHSRTEEGLKYAPHSQQTYKDLDIKESYWILIRKEFMSKEQFEAYKTRYRSPYILEAAMCAFLERIETGAYLYSSGKAWCQDLLGGIHLAVGDFSSTGLCVTMAHGEGRMKDDPPFGHDLKFIGVQVVSCLT